MSKRLSVIVLTAILMLSLTACGGNNSTAPSGNKAEGNSSAPTSPTSIENTTNEKTPSITIKQEGDNTTVIVEGDLVNKFSDIAKKDKDAEFLMEFEGDEEDKAHKKGFSLSFKFQNGDEQFGLFHNSVTNKGYSTRNEDILSFTFNDSKATWLLSGMALPLDEVETVSIWLISGDGEPIQESCEIPIANVKIKSKVNTDSEEAPNSSSSAQEKAIPNYIGTYRQTSEWGNYVVVVEENSLTINDRYVAEMTETAMWPDDSGWHGELLITDTQTGAKGRDGTFQTHTRDEGMYFDIRTFFPDTQEALNISALKD